MDEKDLEQIGGFGIDTQYERDIINYRPNIEYDNPKRSSGALSADTGSQQYGDSLQEVENPVAISTWETAVNILVELDKIEKELSDKLKSISAPIPAKHLKMVREAAKKFGQDIDNTISFGLYKATFNYPDSREAVLIQDVYEDFHSDVNGSLNAELYIDVIQMQNDWTDMTDFIKKGLLRQIVTDKELPSTISVEDSNLEIIYQAEQKMIDDYQKSIKRDKANGDRYRQLIITDYESEEYFKALKEYTDGERNTKQMEKKLHAIAETGELVEVKSYSAMKTIGMIRNTIDFKPYGNKEQEILYHLLKQFKDKSSLNGGIDKIKAIIKLSVDHKNMKVNEVKENLKGIAGRTIKKKINNSLVNGIHLRNGVTTDVHDLLEHFDGVPNSKGFEIVANHIATGLSQANHVYMDQSSDFYKAHTMDAELRTNRLRSLIDKDASRQVYRMLDDVNKHVGSVGKWQNEAELSGWLNGYLEQNS